MDFLGTVKKFCKILGVIPTSDKSSSLLINLIHSTAMLISLVTYCITELAFVYYYASTFIEYAGSGFYCSVTILHVISYIDLLRSRSKLLDLIESSNEIVEIRCENPHIRAIYMEHNRESSELSNSLLNSAFIFAEMFLLPQAAASFYMYYFTDLGNDAFELIFPSVIPWNWKTLSGYLGLVIVQYIWVHCGIFLVICTLPLFIGFCSLFEAFTQDISKTMKDIDDNITNSRQKFSNEDHIRFKRNLTDIISFHSKALELTNRFSDTYGFLIVTTFAVSSILFCSSLLGMNAAIYTGITDVLRFFVCLSVMMIYLVELCFLGNEVTLKYAEISDVICNCSWYKFPLSTQKLLPMFLMAAQKPIYIKGYMNVRCTRESVKKVVNSAVSYFMVLREFYH